MTATPAERSAAGRKAGRASGRVRGHRDHDADSQPSGNPDAPMPTTADPDVDAQMASYVEMAGKPQYWSDIKACEQVRAEIYRTRAAARQDQIERGNLLTRDQVRARDERAAQAFKAGLQSVNELLPRLVPADRLLEAQKTMKEWIAATLHRVAEQIEGAR